MIVIPVSKTETEEVRKQRHEPVNLVSKTLEHLAAIHKYHNSSSRKNQVLEKRLPIRNNDCIPETTAVGNRIEYRKIQGQRRHERHKK